MLHFDPTTDIQIPAMTCVDTARGLKFIAAGNTEIDPIAHSIGCCPHQRGRLP
jgi:hypothetical protein